MFLLHSVLLGIYLTFIYDNLRVFRRVIPHNLFFVSLEDIGYWIYLSGEVFLLMYHESNGMLRWFAVGGALAGIVVYRLLLGRFYVHYVSLGLQYILRKLRRIFKIGLKYDNKLLKIRIKKH